jgi:hypothetical protein
MPIELKKKLEEEKIILWINRRSRKSYSLIFKN